MSGDKLTIVIPGTPVAKGRARSTAEGHHYTPAKTRAWEKAAKLNALVAMRQAGEFGPYACCSLAVTVDVVFAVPKSWSKVAREKALGSYRTSKPDLDNLVKASLDACNGTVWRDDAQVVKLTASKRYGAEAGVTILVDDA